MKSTFRVGCRSLSVKFWGIPQNLPFLNPLVKLNILLIFPLFWQINNI